MKRFFPRLLVALSAMLAVCAGHAESAPKRQPFVVCFEASPEGFDAARALTQPTHSAVSDPLYNRLVGFEPGGIRPVPELAERWEVSRDGREFTFHLRRGVHWHRTAYFTPTRDFNADDVLLSLGRYRDANHPFNQQYGWSEYPYNKEYAQNIEKLEKIDAYTVRVRLKDVDSAFIENLALPTSIIISAEYAARLTEQGRLAEINTQPIGTGPFVFRRYDKDAQIRYDANPDYFRGPAKFSQLVYLIVKDSAVRLQKLKANECQLSISPRPQEIAAIKADPHLKVAQIAGTNVGYLAFNTRKAPLDNANVRRALALAIDRKALFDAVYQGNGTLADTLMAPGMLGYDANQKLPAYDPVQAKALLARAGYAQGLEINLLALPIARPYNPDGRKFAEMIQADWAKVGVKAKIVSYEWGEYIKRAIAGDFDALSLGINSDNGDSDDILTPLFTCANNRRAVWCDTQLETLIEQSQHETAQAKRRALIRRISQRILDEVPLVPIAHGAISQPMRAQVRGFHVSPLNRLVLHDVELD